MMKKGESSQARSRKIGATVGIVIGLALLGHKFLSLSQESAYRPRPDPSIVDTCKKLNLSLPKMVDKETKLVSVSPGNQREIVYRYMLMHFERNAVDIPKLKLLVQKSATSNIHNSKEMMASFAYHVVYSYTYFDKNNRFLFGFSVSE